MRDQKVHSEVHSWYIRVHSGISWYIREKPGRILVHKNQHIREVLEKWQVHSPHAPHPFIILRGRITQEALNSSLGASKILELYEACVPPHPDHRFHPAHANSFPHVPLPPCRRPCPPHPPTIPASRTPPTVVKTYHTNFKGTFAPVCRYLGTQVPRRYLGA